ncbi:MULTISPECIES: hypothetical protein [Bradyrhizobium]|uniref:hypothetical protein n=1 Tax=Bradyrhizobium TaxID=374 RepID=UPI0009D9A784|nr:MULTISPECIES: hypothetical protein [unclassified Bradyrhizobium]MDA9469705.1 hypothetical protein [Bradyrhizobium sp. CCBAU 53415]
MTKLIVAVVMTCFGVSVAQAAPLYECGGDPACQAKRDKMSRSSYEQNINRCLAAAGATREQWRAHAVPRPAADKVRACLEKHG